MKKSKGIVRALLCAAAIVSLYSSKVYAGGFPDIYCEVYAPGGSGWMRGPDGGWRYLSGGGALFGWNIVGDHWYYFDRNGIMQTGWQSIGDKEYYLSETSVAGHPMGSCYLSAQTPDGSFVDENGAKTERPNPYGVSCVEVNITTQTVYVYQGMNLVLKSPCVTGYRGVHDTTAGNWRIRSMERDTYLTGPTWRSHVDYWMPFHGGMGLHDANWRGTSHENFGGNIYVSDGSHGCVNLPHDVAERLYSIAYVGMPVYVHY